VSTPSHHEPTRVLPSTAEQPAPTTEAPAPARFWRQRVPAHLGRARTSTVVLAVLFLAFFGLYLLVRPPAVEYTTVETTSGQTVRVPVSELDPTTEPAAPTTNAPDTGTPTGPTPPTTAPGTTPPRSTPSATSTDETTDEAPTSSRPTGTSRTPGTTRAPATSEEPGTTAEPEPEETSTTTTG
jgi:hypothetical protein